MRTMNRSLTVGRKLFDCLKSLEKTTTLIITLKIPNAEMVVKMRCFRGIFHPSPYNQMQVFNIAGHPDR